MLTGCSDDGGADPAPTGAAAARQGAAAVRQGAAAAPPLGRADAPGAGALRAGAAGSGGIGTTPAEGIFKRLDATTTPVADFAEIIDGDTTATRIPVLLDAYYTTGEVRAHNHLATWTSSSAYVTIATDGAPFTNEGALMPSAISIVRYDTGAAPTSTATISVNTAVEAGSFTMSNVPAP